MPPVSNMRNQIKHEEEDDVKRRMKKETKGRHHQNHDSCMHLTYEMKKFLRVTCQLPLWPGPVSRAVWRHVTRCHELTLQCHKITRQPLQCPEIHNSTKHDFYSCTTFQINKPQTVENDCDNFTFICVRLLDVRWTEPMEVFFSEHCWSSIHNGFGLIPINKLIKKFISIKMLN